MTTRKKYSKEFKLDAVSLVIDQGYRGFGWIWVSIWPETYMRKRLTSGFFTSGNVTAACFVNRHRKRIRLGSATGINHLLHESAPKPGQMNTLIYIM